MVMGGQRHAPAALPPGKRPGVQPAASRHADWAIQARKSRSRHYMPRQNDDNSSIFI